MSREIEADGFITREADLTPKKRICLNCKHYQYQRIPRRYVCFKGKMLTGAADWRTKYEVCDEWESKK